MPKKLDRRPWAIVHVVEESENLKHSHCEICGFSSNPTHRMVFVTQNPHNFYQDHPNVADTDSFRVVRCTDPRAILMTVMEE